jgi:hypothetical protein
MFPEKKTKKEKSKDQKNQKNQKAKNKMRFKYVQMISFHFDCLKRCIIKF